MDVTLNWDADGNVSTTGMTAATTDRRPGNEGRLIGAVGAQQSMDAHYQPVPYALAAGTFINAAPDQGVGVYVNAALSINNATWATLSPTTERWDAAADYWVSSSALIAKSAGLYLIVGNISFAANVTGTRGIRITVNGSAVIAQKTQNAVGGTDTTEMNIATLYLLATNDAVRIQAYQSSGGALNVLSTANISPEWRMVRLQ